MLTNRVIITIIRNLYVTRAFSSSKNKTNEMEINTQSKGNELGQGL